MKLQSSYTNVTQFWNNKTIIKIYNNIRLVEQNSL